MPGTSISLDPFIPAELHDGIDRLVMENLDILPAWILDLYVMWDTDQAPGCSAAITPRVDYRRATLKIGPKWAENVESYRRNVIIHEFLHAHAWPLHAVGCDAVDHIRESNAALADRYQENMREANEQITCDLTELIIRLLKRADGDKSEEATPMPPLVRAEPVDKGRRLDTPNGGAT